MLVAQAIQKGDCAGFILRRAVSAWKNSARPNRELPSETRALGRAEEVPGHGLPPVPSELEADLPPTPGVPRLSVALKYCFKIVVRNRSKKRSKMCLLPSLHELRYLGSVRLHAENESVKIASIVLAPRLCNPIPGIKSALRMVVMPVLVLACPKKSESEQAF
jgi:hypothetical protein